MTPWRANLRSAGTLDLALSASMLIAARTQRSFAVPAPLLATYAHWSIQSRLLRAPQSMLQWGIGTVSVGFALLFASLFGSWKLERRGAHGAADS